MEDVTSQVLQTLGQKILMTLGNNRSLTIEINFCLIGELCPNFHFYINIGATSTTAGAILTSRATQQRTEGTLRTEDLLHTVFGRIGEASTGATCQILSTIATLIRR